jgi:hypothetical protein
VDLAVAFHVSQLNRPPNLSGKMRKMNCDTVLQHFFLWSLAFGLSLSHYALLFSSYILLLKHIQIRQGLQRADALSICSDDLLVVEKYPGAAPIVVFFRSTNVRDVVARVDRQTLV